MNAGAFLTLLWGEQPPGLVLIWSLQTKRSRYFRSPEAANAIPSTERDVYTGVGLSAKDHGSNRRPPNDKVIAIPGLWADIDVNGGPDEKTGAAPTRPDALELCGAFGEPTLIVDSGYGFQAWWLFEGGPWRFTTYGEQRLAAKAAAQWQKLHREHAEFGLDYTHDLARILRLPGTLNGKGGERAPVKVVDQGPRYERDELFELAAQAGDVDPGYTIGESRSISVSCRPDTKPEKLDELLKRAPAFRKVWNHERDDLPSMSEHDMALVSIAALAGWPDQQLADLVSFHRAQHSDPKGTRLDYVERTVARARQTEQERPRRGPIADNQNFDSGAWAQAIDHGLHAPEQQAIALPFDELSQRMGGGLRPGEVCLVGGFTSHGKSVFVDQIADHAAAQGKRVHLYLTEMTAYQRGLRLLARRAEIPFSHLRRRELSMNEWARAHKVLDDMPYGCSIVADWSVEDVVAHVRENKWDIAVVDLIHGFHYTDERDLSKTSSALVRAAKGSATSDFAGTAIVCASHLNDGQMRDQRSNRRPRPGLHSIKGSSSLKQDADVVMFVWRQDDETGSPTADGAIWIAKCRDGEVGGLNVSLDAGRMEFIRNDSAGVELVGAA